VIASLLQRRIPFEGGSERALQIMSISNTGHSRSLLRESDLKSSK